MSGYLSTVGEGKQRNVTNDVSLNDSHSYIIITSEINPS